MSPTPTSKIESIPVLDIVSSVTEMARELVALRGRVAKLERANEDLFADWQAATASLHEAQARILSFEEGGKGGDPAGPEGQP